MAENRINKDSEGNPTTSDSRSAARRIPSAESDAFLARLKEVIGDKKLAWFASDSGVGESTLRNILGGAWPRTDILVAIANAGGVTLDWLATGRGPKTQAELRALSQAPARAPAAVDLDLPRLQAAIATVEEALLATGRVMDPDGKAKLTLAVYELFEEPVNTRARVLKLIKSAA